MPLPPSAQTSAGDGVPFLDGAHKQASRQTDRHGEEPASTSSRSGAGEGAARRRRRDKAPLPSSVLPTSDVNDNVRRSPISPRRRAPAKPLKAYTRAVTMLSSAEANAGMGSMATHQQEPAHSYVDVEDARLATTPYAETVLPSFSPPFSTAQEDGEPKELLRMPEATVLSGVPGQEGEGAVDAPQQPAPTQEKAAVGRHEPAVAPRTNDNARGGQASAAGAIEVSQPVIQPQQYVSFPEPPFAWARPVAMPEPELPTPQTIAMPVPSVPLQHHSLDAHLPSDSPPLVVISPPAMAMPEPSILRESRLQQFLSMPTPDVPNYTPISPAATAIPQVVPDTTYDPASLHVPEWAYTQTPAERADETEYAAHMHRIRLVLQTIPMHVRKSLGREEIIRIVLEALESEQEQGNKRKEDFGARPPWPNGSEEIVYGAGGTEALVGLTEPEWTTPPTDNEWYAIHGGGVLPPGWTATYDHQRQQWYYSDHSIFPPVSIWQDPRSVAVGIAAVPREDADWLASRFGALQAHLQYEEGAHGPVAAEIGRERGEYAAMHAAILASQRAANDASQATAWGDAARFHQAQQAMVRARGALDRISYDARLRDAAFPAALNNYHGVTRGYDVDPAHLRSRTYYTEGPVPPPPLAMSTTQNGKAKATLRKQHRVPSRVYMPTAYPLPAHVKYKASMTPTPYAIPEFCFAWDMLLRSRQDPVPAAAQQ